MSIYLVAILATASAYALSYLIWNFESLGAGIVLVLSAIPLGLLYSASRTYAKTSTRRESLWVILPGRILTFAGTFFFYLTASDAFLALWAVRPDFWHTLLLVWVGFVGALIVMFGVTVLIIKR